MDWLPIIIIAYFILSVSAIIDKIFLSRIVTASVVYALWVSILSILVIGALVFFILINPAIITSLSALGTLTFMTPWMLFVAVIDGMLFTAAIYLLYTALQKGEASRVLPIIGGSMPVIIYLLTFTYQPLDEKNHAALILLIVGTVFISIMPKHESHHRLKSALLALGSSMAFALFFVITHYVFIREGFLNGLVWPRLGTAFAVVFLLAFSRVRGMMRSSLRPLSRHIKMIWLSSQALGAAGFLGQQYVLSIPRVSVAIVSALQGVQYAFILLFAGLLSRHKPHLLTEAVSPSIIVQKILAVGCIVLGLYFVAV